MSIAHDAGASWAMLIVLDTPCPRCYLNSSFLKSILQGSAIFSEYNGNNNRVGKAVKPAKSGTKKPPANGKAGIVGDAVGTNGHTPNQASSEASPTMPASPPMRIPIPQI